MSNIKFGTGGFRAVIGEDFTKENVQTICQAISNIIINENKKKEVCIGYDNRFMSEDYAMWSAQVFAGNGIKVELLNQATATPVCMYATMVKNNDYGVMITASHNPHIYNGVKVFVNEGRDAGVEDCEKIEKEINNVNKINTINDPQVSSKLITSVNYLDDYIDNIINLLKLNNLSNIKAVFDAKYGSSVEAIKLFCNKTKLNNYTIINHNRDAFFGFVMPAPTENNIDKLKQSVKLDNADIGFALDADGDRLAVVDKNGNYVDNNYILAVAYYFLVKYCGKQGDGVKNVATSNLLSVVCNKIGYKCIDVPVGFKYVSKGIIDNNAVIGGESSGGLAIHGHIWGKDSLLSIALCLKAMSVMNKSFDEILTEVINFADGYSKIISDKQYHYTTSQKENIEKILASKNIPPQPYDIDHIEWTDYIKIYYKNSNWLLLRFSGTEPVLRIFAETDSLEESLNLIDLWQKYLGL